MTPLDLPMNTRLHCPSFGVPLSWKALLPAIRASRNTDRFTPSWRTKNDVQQHLRKAASQNPLFGINKMTPKRVPLSRTITLFLLVSLAYAMVGEPQLPDPGNAPMNHDQQIQMGFQAASQVYQQMPVLPDSSPETQYIRKLGEKLVATIPSEHSWPFEFHVIPQKEINAFALPGGPMFVNVGTITAASDEGELAGVMAHEMSHVYMQHSAKQAGKTQTMAALAGLAGAILGSTTDGTLGSLA
jgi:predicted Zn-dependent protease